MSARDELVRDIETTDRLLQYSGYSSGLRQRLCDQKAALLRELAALDASNEDLDSFAEEKKPPRRAKVIEFPRNPKVPKRTG